MNFLPYDELIKKLKIKEDNSTREFIAFVDKEPIAYASFIAVSNPEAMARWKEKVHELIKANSSSVVLRTLCGCEKFINLSSKHELYGYRVPLVSFIPLREIETSFSTAQTYKCRDFKWDGRHLIDGTKIMMEQESK